MCSGAVFSPETSFIFCSLPCFFNIFPLSTLNKQCKIVHKSPPSFAPPMLHSMISLLLLTLKSSFSPHVFIICLAAFLQPRVVSSPVFLKWSSYRPLEGQSWASPFLVEWGKCMCLGPCSFSLGWLFSDFSPCPSLMRFCLMVLPHHLSCCHEWMMALKNNFLCSCMSYLSFFFFFSNKAIFYSTAEHITNIFPNYISKWTIVSKWIWKYWKSLKRRKRWDKGIIWDVYTAGGFLLLRSPPDLNETIT